jgi:hypothetical protein
LLSPARIAVAGGALVLVAQPSGTPLDVVWPSGWAAWTADGRAVLVTRDGALVGRQGDLIQGFAGGVGVDDAFHVCDLGS